MNTLFVQTQGSYLSLDHETIQVKVNGERKMQIPMHHIGGIVAFGNVMFSPFLVHRCAVDGRDIVLCGMNGRFQARIVGPTSGNVFLRRAQYEASDDHEVKLDMARSFVEGKIRGARHVTQRAYRDYKDGEFKKVAYDIGALVSRLHEATTVDEVRGIGVLLPHSISTCFLSCFELVMLLLQDEPDDRHVIRLTQFFRLYTACLREIVYLQLNV